MTLPSQHLVRPCPAELLRENKHMLDKAIRELDRERLGLQNQDKKLITEIKKMAKANQMVRRRCAVLLQACGALPSAACAVQALQHCCLMQRPDATVQVSTNLALAAQAVHPVLMTCAMQESVKVMAKSLVRNRHAITKMYQLKSQLQAVSLRMAVRFAPVFGSVFL